LIFLLKTFLFGKHLSYCYGHSLHVTSKGCDFFQTLIGGWVKNSLKQIVLEPSQLKTKHLILYPKFENPFSPPQIPKIVPCTPNLKSSRHAHSHEKPKENPKHQLLPLLMDAFVIEHVPPKLLLDPFMMWHLH
jgi:hypothetical protein